MKKRIEPVSWQIGADLSFARPMLQPITSKATSALDPSASFLRAFSIAFKTSSGRIVLVRRTSSRRLAYSGVTALPGWFSVVWIVVALIVVLRAKVYRQPTCRGKVTQCARGRE